MKNEVIYQFTGSPFVDAGMWAICEWVGKKEPEELEKKDLKMIAEDIIPVYLDDNWNTSILHGMIFPNHGKISNPSLKRYTYKERKNKALDYFNDLIKNIELISDSGDCISCGRRNVKRRITKSEVPLTGSKALINFFSFGIDGADYCPACTFAIQFSPLVMHSCGKLLLLHSKSEKIMKHWTREPIHEIRSQILRRDLSGCYNEGYKNPINALFHIIQDIVFRYNEVWLKENPSITFYHFINSNRGGDINFYQLPDTVFTFLAYVKQLNEYKSWIQIVKRGYDWKKIKEGEDYKNKGNRVYRNLLTGRPIIRFFLDYDERNVYGNWDLLCYYLKEVRKMDKNRLETLKRVGEGISEYIKKTENIRRLKQLEMAKNYAAFRNILRFIVKDRVNLGEKKSLFSLDEYVNDLFPDGNLGWRETQDILLFGIYENLHEWLAAQKDLVEELSDEEEIKMEG